ncbi:MAG TPA: putative lipid II flippase FtsW [Candidatus Babeliales bacterium]|nr:putative lipid II flippase FtsW [Candidatus Babeliales bacterium]
MITTKKRIYSDLNLFLGCIAGLLIIGLLFIYSSSSIFALERFGSAHYFVKKQLFGVVLGLCCLIAARLVPIDLIKQYSPLLFLGSLILTALTLLPFISMRIHGSSRWLNIAGFGFQPSELLKISLILYLAHFLAKKKLSTSSLLYSYLPFLCILGATAAVLLKQPDFGLTVTLAITAFTLLFIAQFKGKHLLVTLSALIPVTAALVLFKPYRFKRILTFLNPWDDPQGAGFQIIQSLIAIGSGNFVGVGIAHSKQKFFYLPMQHTDFIFSIIAEETGFLGSLLLIFLYCLFLYIGMRIAWQLTDAFATYTVLGFVIMTSLQSIINLAVATGLVPTKGIGLPFVSYGLTSLVCNMMMIGLIINLVHNYRRS